MATLNPYLNFNGNTEEAFNFYKSVFGGELLGLTRYKDMPQSNMPEDAKDKLMHVALRIGPNTLMATDAVESAGQKYIPGNNFSISLEAESKEEADKLFKTLSAGGKVEVPISDAMWGSYWGMFKDKFDIRWMINYTYPKQ